MSRAKVRMRSASTAAAIAAAWLGLTAVAAQAPQESSAGWSMPRTPWGDPDLQGVWSNWDLTPFQAPDPNPDPDQVELAKAARAERYGPEGRGDGIAGGMADIHFGPVSPKRPGAVVVDPPNGRIPAIPEKIVLGKVRRSQDSYEYQDPWERCISSGTPGRMLTGGTGGYNRAYELFQTPDTVVIFQEMIHSARIIPIDNRPHLSADIRLWHGDPRGHWEGDTLVIDSTNFNGKGLGAGGGRQTEALHIVERLTRVDATTISYEARVEDPNVYRRAWTARQPHNLDPEYVIYEYACHEGNTRYMTGVLSQGRARDAEEAAQAAKKAQTTRKPQP